MEGEEGEGKEKGITGRRAVPYHDYEPAGRLAPWFRLHPTEICDSFVYKMMAQVGKGDYPSEPIEGPNLWRLKPGDRVAWVGAERPDRHCVTGILAILGCRESALAVGEAY